MRMLFAILALTAAPAHAADRRYPVGDFDRVVVEGPYSVRLTVGPPSNAVASGSQEALDAVSVEVQGTTLRVRRNRSAWTGSTAAAAPATIVLTTRTLRAASLTGTGRLDIGGGRGLRIDLALDGNGRIEAQAMQADTLSLAARGAGTIVVAGRAGVLTAAIQGSATFEGGGLTAETATVRANSSGSIDLAVRRAATVTADGLGSVTITGTPACTVTGASAAMVRCGAR